jgi:hypothetical protein
MVDFWVRPLSYNYEDNGGVTLIYVVYQKTQKINLNKFEYRVAKYISRTRHEMAEMLYAAYAIKNLK